MILQQSRKKYSCALIIWTIFVLYALLMPAKQLHVSIDLSIPGQDKAIHVLLFAILTFLAAKAAEELKIVIPGWMLFAVLSLFGLSSEIAQHFIKDRSADFWDLLADIAGVTVVLIYLKLR